MPGAKTPRAGRWRPSSLSGAPRKAVWIGTSAAVVLISVVAVGIPTLREPEDSLAGPAMRTEAEWTPQPGTCWTRQDWSRLSGGAGLTCVESGSSLRWTVEARSGDVVRLYGYRDSIARRFRVRVDRGPWRRGVLKGAEAASVVFFTSPSLSAGSHEIELQWVASAGGLTLDFHELLHSGIRQTVERDCPISPADSAAAIEAAISSCPDGSTVMFPRRAVYHQTSTIDLENRKNLTIEGRRSRFVSSIPNSAEPEPNFRITGGHNVTFRDLHVEGNFKLADRRSLERVTQLAVNQFNAGVAIHGGDGITLEDIRVTNTFGDLILLVPTGWSPNDAKVSSGVPRNVRVVRLKGDGAARHCVAITAAEGFLLADSILEDCWYGGVDIEPDAPGESVRRVHLVNNSFDGFNLFAIALPKTVSDMSGIEIRGNRTLTSGDTCSPTLLAGSEDSAQRLLNLVVEENFIRSNGTGMSLTSIEGGAIRRNRIEKVAADRLCGPPVPQGISLSDVHDLAVWDNRLVGYTP